MLTLLLAFFVFAGCGGSEGSDAQPDGSTATGTVELNGVTLTVNGGEFINDEDRGETFLCLHMNYANNSEELGGLTSTFNIAVDQGEGPIEARQEGDYDTEEEANAWSGIDAGNSADCDLYYPVDGSKPVKVQIIDPDDAGKVLAEFEYTPE